MTTRLLSTESVKAASSKATYIQEFAKCASELGKFYKIIASKIDTTKAATAAAGGQDASSIMDTLKGYYNQAGDALEGFGGDVKSQFGKLSPDQQDALMGALGGGVAGGGIGAGIGGLKGLLAGGAGGAALGGAAGYNKDELMGAAADTYNDTMDNTQVDTGLGFSTDADIAASVAALVNAGKRNLGNAGDAAKDWASDPMNAAGLAAGGVGATAGASAITLNKILKLLGRR